MLGVLFTNTFLKVCKDGNTGIAADDRDLAFVVNHLRCGLEHLPSKRHGVAEVHMHLTGSGIGCGVNRNDLDAGVHCLLQNRFQRIVVGGDNGDPVNALRNKLVDNFDFLFRGGIVGAAVNALDAQFVAGFLKALVGTDEHGVGSGLGDEAEGQLLLGSTVGAGNRSIGVLLGAAKQRAYHNQC